MDILPKHGARRSRRCKRIGQHFDGKTLCSSDFLHAAQPQKGLEHDSWELKSSSQVDPAGDAERFPAGEGEEVAQTRAGSGQITER